MSEPYRVVQWATGNIGRKALRGIVEHPAMTLAGLYVYDPEKVGHDAGELCGMDAVGVLATGSIEDVLAAGADCVLYMPRMFDADDVCLLLESGANVVTTCGQFHHPPSMDAALRARVEAACEAGGASIHSTGSSPGFISEAVPLVLTSIQRRLDSVSIEERHRIRCITARPMPFMPRASTRSTRRSEPIRSASSTSRRSHPPSRPRPGSIRLHRRRRAGYECRPWFL